MTRHTETRDTRAGPGETNGNLRTTPRPRGIGASHNGNRSQVTEGHKVPSRIPHIQLYSNSAERCLLPSSRTSRHGPSSLDALRAGTCHWQSGLEVTVEQAINRQSWAHCRGITVQCHTHMDCGMQSTAWWRT